MVRFAVTLTALVSLAALGACGARPAGESAGSTSRAPASSSTTSPSVLSPGPHACPDHVVEGQETRADLDGDGTLDQVRFSPGAGSVCPAGLSVTIDAEQVVADTGTLAPASMRAVSVPGRRGQLVLVRETHPRGGFQDHLFGYADGKLAELEVAGRPLLPFVATDTVGDPSNRFMARCTEGGITVLRAVTHQPIGIAPAFDVVSTTYTIDGTAVRSTGTEKVRDNVLGDDLATVVPALSQKSDVLTEGCS